MADSNSIPKFYKFSHFKSNYKNNKEITYMDMEKKW